MVGIKKKILYVGSRSTDDRPYLTATKAACALFGKQANVLQILVRLSLPHH